MSDSKTVLKIEVHADGTASTSAALAKVGDSAGAAGRQASAASRGWASMGRVLGGVGTGLRRAAGALTGTAGLLGAALSGAALASAVQGVARFDAGLVNLRHSSGATKDEIAQVSARLTAMAGDVGRTREELLAAASASVNLGLGLDEIVGSLEDASNWARLLGVDVASTTRALTAAQKVAGEGISLEDQMAVMDVAVRRSGMMESDALALMGRVMPEISAVTGLDGLEGLKTIGQMLAAVGPTLGAEQLQGGLRSMGRTFARDRDRLGRAGVDTSSFAAMFEDLAGIAHRDAAQLQRLRLPDELLAFVIAAGDGLDRFVQVGEEMEQIDVGEFQEKLTDAANSSSAEWDKLKVKLQEVLIPLGEGALKWLVDHRMEIVGAFEAVVAGLVEMARIAGWITDGMKSSREESLDAAVNEAGKGETPEERVFRLTQALTSKYGNERDRILSEARSAGMDELEIARAQRAAPLPSYYAGGEVDEFGRVSHGEQMKIGEGEAIGRGLRAMQEELIRRLEIKNNITIRVDPETVHTDADARNDGRREPMVTTDAQRG